MSNDNLTVRELANKLGVTKATITNNANKDKSIKVDNIIRITPDHAKQIADKIEKNKQKYNRQFTYENKNTQSDNVEDNNKNTTNESNNSNDYESVIEQYEARIKDLKEAHEKHIRDLNKQLDKKQETINNLTVSMTMQGLTNKPNTNEDNRSIINSNSGSNSNNVDNTNTYEDAHTRPTDDPVDVSNQTNTNIEDTNTNVSESNKRKGFFAWLFNL